jgi:hypothetical protein
LFSALISFVFWTRFRKRIATCFIKKKSTLKSSMLSNLVAQKICILLRIKLKLYNTENACIIVKYKHALQQGLTTLSCLPICDPISLNNVLYKCQKELQSHNNIIIFNAMSNVWWPLCRVSLESVVTPGNRMAESMTWFKYALQSSFFQIPYIYMKQSIISYFSVNLYLMLLLCYLELFRNFKLISSSN